MDDSAPSFRPDDPFRTGRGWTPRTPFLTAGLALLTVVAAWILGYLPWVIDGFRLSGRSSALLGEEGLDGVRLVIPLIAGELNALIAFATLGAVAATLLPLAFVELPRMLSVVVAALVLALTTLVLTFVARSSIADHVPGAFSGDERVLDGLVLGVFAITFVAGLVGCIASFQVGFLPVATALAVAQLPVWLGHLGDGSAGRGVVHDLVALVMLTSAFVISVRRSAKWMVLWPLALAIVWAATPAQIGIGAMADRLRPGAGLQHNLSDVFASGYDVFRASFWEAPQSWWPGVVAAGLGVVWVLVRRERVRADR
ncbi:MAG: hypothetical protein JWQ74_1161 [Marmoricola sp.]|nr:hypothetical protein [Marmoricola sp.]